MNRQPSRRSSLFLMELMIAILFFTLAATVCVRFFVKSQLLESESLDLNHATASASSVAEIVRSQDSPLTFLADQFPEGEPGKESFSIYYDKNWEPCSASDAFYTTILRVDTADSFITGEITVQKGSDSLYELIVKRYLGKEAS